MPLSTKLPHGIEQWNTPRQLSASKSYAARGVFYWLIGKPRPQRIWNRIPDKIRTAIIDLALAEPDLSPRELAVNFTDTTGSFSALSGTRLLDCLIVAPQRATMSRNSSLTQSAHSVRQVLTVYRLR